MANIFSVALLAVVATCAIAARIPPPHTKHALMARFIVNEAEWTSIATISADEKLKGYPFANLKSVADGAIGKGNGIPYIFQTPLDFTGIDLEKDNRATYMMTLAQGDFCKEKGYDPMDPRCARVILTGTVKKIDEADAEHAVAKEAIYTRHPWLKQVPANHNFYFAKLEIESVIALTYFGAATHIDVDEYLNTDVSSLEQYAQLYR